MHHGAGEAEQAAPGDGRGAANGVVLEPHQGEEALRQPVLRARAESDVVPVLPPGLVQQGQQAVVEEVEECRADALTLAGLIGKAFHVIRRQRRIGAVHAEKGRLHEVLMRQFAVEMPRQRDVRGGEPHAGIVAQANALAFGGIGVGRFQVVTMQPVQTFEQAKEVVASRLFEQPVAQIRGCVPLRIGHA